MNAPGIPQRKLQKNTRSRKIKNRRNGQSGARHSRFKIAADQELDEVQAQEHDESELPGNSN